jgi:MarR family transcriptional regulator, lower aerobic nicotinate degradation pathway regulator
MNAGAVATMFRMVGSGAPKRLQESTIYLLTQAIKKGARVARPVFGGERLRFGHYVTLAQLAEAPMSSQRELGAALGTDPSDLVTVLDELVAAGLATRAVDPNDRRRRTLSVTRAGRAWLRERDALATEYDQQLCAALPDGGAELREQLRRLLAEPETKPDPSDA